MPADRTLIATGTVGAVIAAICCATPLLVVLFGLFGVTAWLAIADYVLIPALLLCFGLIGVGFYLRRTSGQTRCEPGPLNEA